VQSVEAWLPDDGVAVAHVPSDMHALATIVYTSGTTGRPKGVMLSHHNILSNAAGASTVVTITHNDILLSFLPLSHMFERTCGYYLSMMTGATTAYARSVQQLGEDLQTIRPTKLISVPRIYERVYTAIKAKLDSGPAFRRWLFEKAVAVGWARFEREQRRCGWQASFLLWPLLKVLVADKITARMGGRLTAAIAGGAALSPEVSKVFIGLGLPVVQGYGLTETSPIACANSERDNLPASVGKALPGVEVRLGEKDALMIRGPNVMLGYWNNPQATQAMISPEGWLNSGDTARIDAQGHVFITGRLKEIIVMSNGEKIPPVDIEAAIMQDRLFDQVMLIGEGKPYLSVIAVLNQDEWKVFASQHDAASDAAALRTPPIEKALLARIALQMKAFPGYAQVRRITACIEPWTVEDGMLTPTLKLKRNRVMERFAGELDQMYSGH
jgi:long-chain acyl-CoA synthetase